MVAAWLTADERKHDVEMTFMDDGTTPDARSVA